MVVILHCSILVMFMSLTPILASNHDVKIGYVIDGESASENDVDIGYVIDGEAASKHDVASGYAHGTTRLAMTLNNLTVVKKSTKLLPELQGTLSIIRLILEGIGLIIDLVKGNEESPELKYMREQFGKMDSKLNTISKDIKDIQHLINWLLIESKLQEAESRILATNRDINDYIKYKGDYYEKQFIYNYDKRDITRTVTDLHAAIVGARPFDKSIISRFLLHPEVKYNRGKLAALIKRLLQLVTMGIQEMIAFRRLTKAPDVKEIIMEWQKKMDTTYPVFEKAIRECVDNFRTHAEEDITYRLDKHHGRDHSSFVQIMQPFLSIKYDWLQWYTAAYNPVGGWNEHTVGGDEYIHYFRRAGRNFVAGWRDDCCENPTRLEKVRNHLKTGNFPTRPADQGYKAIVQWLSNNAIPFRIVHVVRFGNGLRAAYSSNMTVFQNRDVGGHSSSFVVMLV